MVKFDFHILSSYFLLISLYFPIVIYNRKIQGNQQKIGTQNLKIKFLHEKSIFFVRIFFSSQGMDLLFRFLSTTSIADHSGRNGKGYSAKTLDFAGFGVFYRSTLHIRSI